ncbi:hypothetical protein HYDPIDRAFT_115522 [Hydnomerulius pinastri MD-312]|uniref:Beta-lactamase-related domain-containing protein n=1 Tax=Hydnomerulius pinastri MD-312 TaxID=994086 RepID=A0A0C9W554_9AGAM|nr:hypothetical protein HYDPIDRAFT_115522 [Hydnomerulius pinastri MD-312]
MAKKDTRDPAIASSYTAQRRALGLIPRWSFVLNLVLALVAIYLYRLRPALNVTPYRGPQPSKDLQPHLHPCNPPFPALFRDRPPSTDDVVLKGTLRGLDEALDHYFTSGGIDSLSVAVVSSNGSLFEWFRGPLRANETDVEARGLVDRNSIYRVASISKLSTALETLILRDRGVLSLDDSVATIFPQLDAISEDGPITYRQLMSHMSGLARDLPAGDGTGNWPLSLHGRGPPPFNGLPFPDLDTILKAVVETPRVVAPYTYPVYSNTGYNILGMANVVANQKFQGDGAPATQAELLRRDIFHPLDMNTVFAVAEAPKMNFAISSTFPSEIDLDFRDASNPSAGQMSSLADLVKLMRVLIDPSAPESPLPARTVREWMRPLHNWFDDFSAVGLLWEIQSIHDRFGRKLNVYQKIGELIGHHTSFAINPMNSYGVIVLTTGPTSRTSSLNELIFEHVQAGLDDLLRDLVSDILVGHWVSDDSRASMTVEIDNGSVFVSEYVVDSSNILDVMQGSPNTPSRKAAAWFTSEDEFRLATPGDSDGCLYSWLTLDLYGHINGVSVNSVRILDLGSEKALYLPALDIQLKRR